MHNAFGYFQFQVGGTPSGLELVVDIDNLNLQTEIDVFGGTLTRADITSSRVTLTATAQISQSNFTGAGVVSKRALGLEILRLHPDIVRNMERDHFDRWRLDIDNWAVCDFVGTRILGPWVAAEPEDRLTYLERLVGDPHLYSRRLGLVASVHLNSGGTEYGEWTLGQVDRLIDERDPMITKAVSWSLRQMIKHQASDVETYVDSRADRMAALPRREVRNKLNTGRKSGRAD